MSDNTTPLPAQYHAYIGLRDCKDARGRDQLEMAVSAHPELPHDVGSPHMIVIEYLRRHWDRIVAAAEIEHKQFTAEAMRDKITAAGGAVNAATLKH